MASVLIVDDSAMDLHLAGQLLKEDPQLAVSFAADGQEALEQVAAGEPDIVVTDLQMPKLDGLELVTRLRMYHPRVAVVLMTAHGSESIAARALEQGAASYVPKNKMSQMLLQTVHDILAMSEAQRTYERLIECSTRTVFDFRLENDLELIHPLVSLVQQMVGSMGLCDSTGQLQVGVALEQAMTNAMLHGNLELDKQQLRQGLRERDAIIAQRRQQMPYAERRVTAEIYLTRQEVRLRIQDEGPGFDVASIFPTSNTEHSDHRGMVLMRTFMDDVQFNSQGNEVVMIKRQVVSQ